MIIVVITGPTLEDARRQLRLSSRYADMVEFRLDLLEDGAGSAIVRRCRKPWIATCRPVREGGAYDGEETGRLKLLAAFAQAGAAYVDIELDAIREFRTLLVAAGARTKLIVSKHLFASSSPDIRVHYNALSRVRADVVKLAFMADDAWQISLVRQFLALARAERQKAIALAMGVHGEASRILYKILGGWATYAAPEQGDPSAPGQLPARTLCSIMHAHERTRRTRVFGLIGNPVGQSKGIYVHNPLYRSAGYDGVYVRFPVGDLARFMKEVGPLLSGCSVTLPHKRGMMHYCGAYAPGVAAIGAVNTVVRKRGTWYGANTDAGAALDAIEERMPVKEKRLVIIGAGGAARAIAAEAKRRGSDVVIVNRTAGNARLLAEELGVRWAPLSTLADLRPVVLANATPAGMWPAVEESPVAAIPTTVRLAFDAIYNPPETRFLRMAMDAHCEVITGAEMYAKQAVEQIRLLTGLHVQERQVRRLFDAARETMSAPSSGTRH
jgi:3-dehydroquinate dehydratase/shikimate dehydrogenase